MQIILVGLKLDLSFLQGRPVTHVPFAEVGDGHQVDVLTFIVERTVTTFVPPANHHFARLPLL